MLISLIASVAVAASSPAAPAPITVADSGSCALTVVLQCAVAPDGAASDCKVISEDPNTMGAGDAALAMSRSFHLAPREVAGPVLLPVRIQTGQCRSGR